MGAAFQYCMRWFNRLDRQEWVIVLVAVMAFGLLCMRGHNSRD